MEPSTSPYCEMSSSAVPRWLGSLLAAPYFTPCSQHAALHKSERNFFCVDCAGTSLCSVCAQREHAGPGHTLLQIRKSSYHDAVRVADVGRLLDLAGIQVYVINGAKIVFLNGRPQARPMKGAPYHCETCHRTLLDACRFCSIGCKLACLQVDSSLAIVPGPGSAARRTHADHAASAHTASEEDSIESAHRHAGARAPGTTSPCHPRTPTRLPMLLEEQDDASSDEHDLGNVREKRRRLRMQEEEEVNSSYPPLVDAMQPGTPPLGMSCSSARTHKRKGVPHRSPVA